MTAPWPRGTVDPLRTFTRVFVAIWLLYDVLDWALAGTATLLDPLGGHPPHLLVTQIVVGLCQVGVLLRLSPRLLLLVAALVRGHFALHDFPLNDFLYYAVVTVWLVIYYPAPLWCLRDRGTQATTAEGLGLQIGRAHV